MYEFKSYVNKETIVQCLSQCLFGMLGALIVVTFFHFREQKIATINITALEDSFVLETAKLSLPDEIKKQRVTAFASTLNLAVERLSNENHIVLLPTQAVISTVPDVTNEVATQIKKGMAS